MNINTLENFVFNREKEIKLSEKENELLSRVCMNHAYGKRIYVDEDGFFISEEEDREFFNKK